MREGVDGWPILMRDEDGIELEVENPISQHRPSHLDPSAVNVYPCFLSVFI